jgi:hypothetical protein
MLSDPDTPKVRRFLARTFKMVMSRHVLLCVRAARCSA